MVGGGDLLCDARVPASVDLRHLPRPVLPCCRVLACCCNSTIAAATSTSLACPNMKAMTKAWIEKRKGRDKIERYPLILIYHVLTEHRSTVFLMVLI
uniref:Uncharacterized protein n=1 Tax=Oryza meridionalis TaxID=40149 RepID=A0A0E0EQV0_9ORYZ